MPERCAHVIDVNNLLIRLMLADVTLTVLPASIGNQPALHSVSLVNVDCVMI